MILGLHGLARSGKDTFGEYLLERLDKKYHRSFQHMAFATQLKNMCKDHFELSDDQLWESGKNIREKPDLRFSKRIDGCSSDPSDYWSPREIMQELGSFYRKINYDYWVYALDRESKKQGFEDIIITDVRHINECEYVKKNNGVLIKTVRPVVQKIHGMDHESETALNDYTDFDITINNGGTLDDLYTAADTTADAIITMEKLMNKGEVYNGK
jgi:hypothetical protein